MILYVSDSDIMELNTELESLDLEEGVALAQQNKEEEEEEEPAKKNVRRSLRRRSINKTPKAPEKVKPKDVPPRTDQQIANLYLTQTVKRKPLSLETIFEEPRIINDTVQYTSIKKFRRMINFKQDGNVHSQNRIKKRQFKAKKLKKIVKHAKISMEHFMDKLKNVHDGDDP